LLLNLECRNGLNFDAKLFVGQRTDDEQCAGRISLVGEEPGKFALAVSRESRNIGAVHEVRGEMHDIGEAGTNACECSLDVAIDLIALPVEFIEQGRVSRVAFGRNATEKD